jgi:arabinogalactan oligomer/maltooligosaccharide transport system permease protein
MRKTKSLRIPLVRMLPIMALLMCLSLLLPWVYIDVGEGALGYNAIKLLNSDVKLLNIKLPTILAVISFLLSVLIALKPNKKLLILQALLFAAGTISAVVCMLTAKELITASGISVRIFNISHLSYGIWSYMIISFVAVVINLKAMYEPVEYVALSIMASVWLLPIFWLVITSFRQEAGAYTPYLLPKDYTLDNFSRLFTETQQFNFPRWYMNTLVVAIFTCILTTSMVLMLAYTFSRLRFPSRKTFMNIGLILGMFPGFMSMIAVYHILKAIGLAKSLISLVLVYTGGGVLNYLIAKGFFDTIPKSLDEAATLDGASKSTIFRKIILPSSKPIVVYTAITAFIAPWVDFIFVSVIMKDDYQNYTVALGLYRMLEREHIYDYFTRFCAGAVLVAIPITLLFIKIQKFYVAGVVGGAVKG